MHLTSEVFRILNSSIVIDNSPHLQIKVEPGTETPDVAVQIGPVRPVKTEPTDEAPPQVRT